MGEDLCPERGSRGGRAAPAALRGCLWMCCTVTAAWLFLQAASKQPGCFRKRQGPRGQVIDV